jgi:acetyl esterase
MKKTGKLSEAKVLHRIFLTACSLVLLLFTLPMQDADAQQTQKKKDKTKTGPTVEATNVMEIQPEGPKPDWAPTIDPQMHAVIEELQAKEQPKFTDLTPFQVRNAKLPAEAAMSLMVKAGIEAKEPKVDIGHRLLSVSSEDGVLVRTYTPLSGSGPFPVIVYYHGGGWVIADLETYEPSAKALAEKTGAIVVSVAYRQAPEHTFPAAHEDSFAAYKWVVENAAELGGDPERIATAGESAGGNLAVAVALMAKEQGVALPDHILSVYPIADGDVESPTYEEYANAAPLNKPLMDWFFSYYTPNGEGKDSPWISLVDADLSGLPATTIINAEIDPLRAEGEELAQKMEAAGVDVVREVYPGVTHEFFGMAAILEQAEEAQKLAADRLKQAFQE